MKERDATNGSKIVGETIKGQLISEFLYVAILRMCCPQWYLVNFMLKIVLLLSVLMILPRWLGP